VTDFTVDGGYIQLPVTTDPDDLVAAALDAIATAFPGWTSREGHLEVALLEQFAQMASTQALVAASMAVANFIYFGSLVGITSQPGASASVTTTWTMIDNAGYTVPAGTILGFQVTGTDLVLFQTLADFTVAPGDTATDPGAIEVAALDVGSAANGIAAGTMTLVDSLAFVASVVSTDTTSGGVDAETEDAYLDRLSAEMRLLTPRPILAEDFALLAPKTTGVFRALAIDGLYPGRTLTDGATTNASPTFTSVTADFTADDVGRTLTGTGIPGGTTILTVSSGTTVTMSANATATATGLTVVLGDRTDAERAVAVAAVDASGVGVSPTIKAQLDADLQAKREVNFVVSVIDPTDTEIDVTYVAVASTGADSVTVKAAIDAALAAFLSPADWGGGSDSPPVWTNVTVVRYLDVAHVIHSVAGVDHITSLSIGAHGGSLGTSDVNLSGNAPLPTTGTISGTVT